jgi:DNA-binding NarL/FixJ family response regulator
LISALELESSTTGKPQKHCLSRVLSSIPHTVKNHLKSIFRKLDVSSQAELLARVGEAERHGG